MRRLLAAVSMVGLLVGCSGSPTPAPTSTAPSDRSSGSTAPATPRPQGERVWRYTKGDTASRFVLVGSTLVGHIVSGKRLALVGLDPANGRERWRRPASPGWIAPGVAVEVETVDDQVILLEPSGRSADQHFLTRVAVVDPGSGRITARSAEAYRVLDDLRACDGSVCFSASTPGIPTPLRMSVETGKITLADKAFPKDAPPADSRALDDEIWQVYGDREKLARVVDGRIVWSRPMTSVFAPGYSPDGGWYFVDHPDAGVITGEVGRYRPDATSFRLQESMMVGLDAKTGKVLWREREATRFCPAVRLAFTADPVGLDLRCTLTGGTVRYGPDKVSKVTAVLQRFDPKTGEVAWSIDLDRFSGSRASWERTSGLTDDNALTVLVGGQVRSIDPATGAQRPLAARAQVWCTTSINRPYLQWPLYGTGRGTRTTDGFGTGCDGRGRATAVTTTAPPGLSATTDGLSIVTSDRAVTAYRS